MGAEQLPLFGSVREPPVMSEVVLGRAVKFCACGNEVAPGRQKFCGTCAARRNAPKPGKTVRSCTVCGKTFEAVTAMICSELCRYYANRDAILDRMAERRQSTAYVAGAARRWGRRAA